MDFTRTWGYYQQEHSFYCRHESYIPKRANGKLVRKGADEALRLFCATQLLYERYLDPNATYAFNVQRKFDLAIQAYVDGASIEDTTAALGVDASILRDFKLPTDSRIALGIRGQAVFVIIDDVTYFINSLKIKISWNPELADDPVAALRLFNSRQHFPPK